MSAYLEVVVMDKNTERNQVTNIKESNIFVLFSIPDWSRQDVVIQQFLEALYNLLSGVQLDHSLLGGSEGGHRVALQKLLQFSSHIFDI